MNELLRSVLTRRSTHSFTQAQIKDSELHEILAAGKFVSDVVKNQIWHFTVIQNKQILAKINTQSSKLFSQYGRELFLDGIGEENFNFLRNAPTLIIISGSDGKGDTQDAANATFGNMMLAADKLAIGACWTHSVKLLFDSSLGEALIAQIGIPAGYLPLCAGGFGYKVNLAPKPTRKEDAVVLIIR